MALSFANTAGNLFNRLGRVGKLARVTRVYQGDIVTYFNALMAQYDSSVASPLQLPEDNLPTLRDSTRDAAGKYLTSLQNTAKTTVLEMVKADKPSAAGSIDLALQEVYAQMVTAGASVQQCVVTATPALGTGNSGDGTMVVSAKRGDGRQQDLAFPEVAYVRCTTDSQTGGATAGQEAFTYYGAVASKSVWNGDYPIGSGFNTAMTCIDATVSGTSSTYYGNILVNGSFETFTVANLPDSWTAVVGVAGTNFAQGATVYSGTKSLKFIGSALNTCLAQTLFSGALYPSRSFAVSFWCRNSVNPAAGVLTVELVDGNNTVINDDQGVANSFTVNVVTLGTTFVNKTGVFRLPKLVPSVVKIRLRASTAITAGTDTFIDHLAMGQMTQLYAGGPGAAVFSGATRFAANDYHTLTVANDYGGATSLSTFQWLMDRLFGTRNLGILYPTSGAPTVPDTIITS